MKIAIIITAVATAILAVIGTIWYTKAIKDDNDNLIPDQVEDAVKEVKRRSRRVKEETKDVVEDIADALKGVKDIKKAAKGAKRKGRPRKNSL